MHLLRGFVWLRHRHASPFRRCATLFLYAHPSIERIKRIRSDLIRSICSLSVDSGFFKLTLRRQRLGSLSVSDVYFRGLSDTDNREAVKRGRVWYTTRRALAAYRQSLTD